MDIDSVIGWLMEGDPAVRWQVRRDLLGEPKKAWQTERAGLATEGWGARLLAERSADGRMAGKVWFELEKDGQPSRWNTLRALRVLQWWTSRPAAP